MHLIMLRRTHRSPSGPFHLTWLGAPSGGRGLPGCSLRHALPLPRGPPISVCALLGADPQRAQGRVTLNVLRTPCVFGVGLFPFGYVVRVETIGRRLFHRTKVGLKHLLGSVEVRATADPQQLRGSSAIPLGGGWGQPGPRRPEEEGAAVRLESRLTCACTKTQ